MTELPPENMLIVLDNLLDMHVQLVEIHGPVRDKRKHWPTQIELAEYINEQEGIETEFNQQLISYYIYQARKQGYIKVKQRKIYEFLKPWLGVTKQDITFN